MAWNGYYEFDGNEIVNVPRTAAYARARGAAWFVDTPDGEIDLAPLLGEPSYTLPDGGASYDFGIDVDGTPYILGGDSIGYDTDGTPFLTPSAGLDDGVGFDTDGVPYVIDGTSPAPWYSAGAPESVDFLGVMPAENGITGASDSTRTASTTQFTGDGGFVSTNRDGTKSVVFDLYLLAMSEAGAAYGFEWLKSVTSLKNCTGRRTKMFGSELKFASSAPSLRDFPGMAPTAYWSRLTRRLRRVKNTDGPVITSQTVRRQGNCGLTLWRVTMTLTAGDPVVYADPVPVVDDLGGAADPYVPGITGTFSNTATDFVEVACDVPVPNPVYDPNCVPLVAPPDPPDVPLSCVALPIEWDRRYVEIPASVIPKFGEARPIVTITAGDTELRNIRLRWFHTEDFLAEPLCGHFAVQLGTYVPANSSLTIDGVAEAAYVDSGGLRRRSDSLILGQFLKPITWFGLSCDESYTVAMDVPKDSPPVKVEISMTERSR